jgi:hypothetical protein
MTRNHGGTAGQRNEDVLRDVLGEVSVAVHAAECRGIDGVNVTPYDLGEGVFGAGFRIAAKEEVVTAHDLGVAPAERETEQSFCDLPLCLSSVHSVTNAFA